MNTWFRKVGMGALALTLAGGLAGCNDGDGGAGGLIRLFFGINGQGTCTSVIIEVNLDEANAVIARDEFGDVQCAINSLLDEDGCEIEFEELENGDLRATISGCDEGPIPAVTNLFDCFFEDVDISALQETAFGQCACASEPCDPTPPVCISEDPDPTSCEDCDNGIDDDDDGLIDCEDPQCENNPACGTSTTTTTSTSVSTSSTTTLSTTTTSVSTTTSTTNPCELDCTVTFRLDDDVNLGSLQWDTDYSDVPGFPVGEGGDVDCASLVTGALYAANDIEDQELIDQGLISIDGFEGPINVAECAFKGCGATPQIGDLVITVTEASAPDLTPIAPLPDVSVGSITCTGSEICDNGTDDDGDELVDCNDPNCNADPVCEGTTTTEEGGTTTTAPPGNNFSIQFTLDTASAGVGALQFDVDYAGAPGEFQDSAGNVDCSNEVVGALFAPNDNEATDTLTLGIIALTPFTAPAELVQCIFNSTGETPVPADFAITIADATDSDGNPITVAVSASVTPL